jgi:hypothetical protein
MRPGESGGAVELPVRSQAVVVCVFIGALLVFSFFWIFFGFTHLQIFCAVVGVAFFLISFFSIRTGLILMALSMLLSPEFSVGSIGIRDVTLRVEDLLIPVLGLAWFAQITLQRKWTLFVRTPLNAPILLLLGLSIFSTVQGAMTGWVVFMSGFFYIFKTLEYFTIFFLVVNYVRDEKQIKLFLFYVLLTACLVGFYTFTQVPSVQIFSPNRISAPFEKTPEPATVGGYMAFLLVIIVSLFLFEKKWRLKIVYLVLALILVIPFLYTLNRTSYAALIAGIALLAVLARQKWFTFVTIALLLTSPLWAPGSVKDRIAFTWIDAKNPGRTLGVDYSAQERFYAYRRMWMTARRSPLIGLGVTSWQTPDSQWARTIHEVGFLGLWLWLWIFWRLFRMSFWLFRYLDFGTLKGMVLGYAAALAGLMVHANGAITFYIIRIMEPFWFITGLVVSLYLIKVNEKNNPHSV